MKLLTESKDPRVVGGFDFDHQPYLGSSPQWEGEQ